MRARTTSIGLFGALVAAAAVGCKTTDPAWLRDAGDLVDDMAAALDEFGHVTMSNPILSRPDERFAFNLTKGGADRYFEEAKKEIQGQVGYSEQVVQAFSGGLRGRGNLVDFMKFQEALELHRLDLRRVASRDRLLDGAALDEYTAAIAAAADEPDATKRAALIAAAKRKLAADQVQPSASPTFPESPGEEGLPAAASGIAKSPDEAKGILTHDKFQAAGALLGDGTPVVANRSALITAAGDQAVESIFRVLGRPDEAQRFAGKVAFFGVSTVAVAPGRATRTGFAAEVATAAEIVYLPASEEALLKFLKNPRIPAEVRKNIAETAGVDVVAEVGSASDLVAAVGSWNPRWSTRYPTSHEWLPAPTRYVPMVAAISPLTDVQTYDTTNSTRRRTQFAFNLSIALRYAGLVGEAEAFEQYVRNVEKDVAVRTPEVSVTAFTNGHLFGYQIGPTLRALGDPSDEDPETEYVLGRQSFPVLLVLGLDRDDLAPKVFAGNYAVPAGKGEQDSWTPRLRLLVPQLRFTQVSRWVPLDCSTSSVGLRESDRLEWMARAEDLAALTSTSFADRTEHPHLKHLLKYRKGLVQHHLFGSYADQALPEDLDGEVATLSSVVQSTYTLEKDGQGAFKPVELVLLGTHLESLKRGKADIQVVAGKASIGADPILVGTGALQVVLTVKEAGAVLLAFKDATGHVELVTPISLAAPQDPKTSIKSAVPSRLVASADPAFVHTLVVLGEHLDLLGDLAVGPNAPTLGSGAANSIRAKLLSPGAIRVEVTGAAPGPLVVKFGKLTTPPVEVLPPGESSVTYTRDDGTTTETRTVEFKGSQSAAQAETVKEVLIELDGKK